MTAEFSTAEERNFSLINIINDLNRVSATAAQVALSAGFMALQALARLPPCVSTCQCVVVVSLCGRCNCGTGSCRLARLLQEIEAQEVENGKMRKQAQTAKRTGELTEESRRKLFEVRAWHTACITVCRVRFQRTVGTVCHTIGSFATCARVWVGGAGLGGRNRSSRSQH